MKDRIITALCVSVIAALCFAIHQKQDDYERVAELPDASVLLVDRSITNLTFNGVIVVRSQKDITLRNVRCSAEGYHVPWLINIKDSSNIRFFRGWYRGGLSTRAIDLTGPPTTNIYRVEDIQR